jgi:uncharacterized protein YdhG (YjbR/CyaY superfamily)
MNKAQPRHEGSIAVDAFLEGLDHPLKREVQELRAIIMRAADDITEQIKWAAPSFSHKGTYLVTFNLRSARHVHLVFHHPMIAKVNSSLLEGEYKDRRMAYFANMGEVTGKKPELLRVLKALIAFQK